MTKKNPPSIFNDVIGPVMRGPSSSHTAASVRIGKMVRQLLGEKPKRVVFEFDPKGSLATTYETQGSAIGLAAGLLNWEVTHPEIQHSVSKARDSDIEIEFVVTPIQASHPSTYQITAEGEKGEKLECAAISTGGGMIDFVRLSGFEVSIQGGYYETLLVIKKPDQELKNQLSLDIKKAFPDSQLSINTRKDQTLINLKTTKDVFSAVREIVEKQANIQYARLLEPVMPVMSQIKYSLPFRTYKELIAYAQEKDLTLSALAQEYESERAGISKEEVFDKMREMVEITKTAIRLGLEGTVYEDRILQQQSHLIAANTNKLISSPTNKIIAYTSALMEVKSSMGVIIAAPTAGACGVLGGALFGATEGLEKKTDDMINAFLAAGLVGVFVADKYTFAAEEGGCQVECGAGSGMAAAGIVELMEGNFEKALSAASMAMQNMVGLICDPVADRVEVPCLGKNILGATNALNAANMSLAGFDEIIPLDEVVDAMKRVGDEMPASVCCTGLSGLSTTPCSKSIYNKLKKN